MKLLEEDLKCTKPILCEVQRDYIKYMHDVDWRVSVKYNNRKFVGLAVRINGRFYVIPLTSQTTKERVARGKKKRSAAITTFIKVGGEEINLKSITVYRERYDKNSRNYHFFNKTCCDFKKLEIECDKWEQGNY